MRRIAFIFGCLIALATQAMAQSFPQTLPAQTVYGRLGVSAGPGQAIPFATLNAQLSGTETTVNDVNYAVVAADRTIVYTAITAARTVTLLSASAYPPGTRIHVFDRSGSASATKTISLAPTGADLINGANATFLALIAPYTEVEAETDGISKWTALLSATSFANPTATVGCSAVNGAATTAMRSDGAPALDLTASCTFTGNSTWNPTSGNAFTATTASGTTARIFNTSQTGPSTSTTAGNLQYNAMSVTDGANVTGDPQTWGFLLQHLVTANAVGQKYGFGIELTRTAAVTLNGDMIAMRPRAISSANNSGSGGLYGANPQAIKLSGDTTANQITAMEADVQLNAGSAALWRFAVAAVSTGAVRGTVDAAYEVRNTVAGGEFLNGMLLHQSGGAVNPIATTGCVICTDTTSATITTGMDLSSYTISGNFLKSANYTLTGAGVATLTNNAAPSSPAASHVSFWTDSTDLRFHDKNSAGAIGTTVVADTGASNNFLTAISAAGVISKAQPAFSNLSGSATCAQLPALTGDVTTSAGACATTLANIPSATPMAGSLLASVIAAPGTPAANKDSIWVDSTDKRLHDKNDAGTIGTTVVANTGASSNFLTAISAAGVVSRAQPATTDLSDIGTFNLSTSGTIKTTNTTDSTTTATGALQSSGGLGVVKAAVIGTSVTSAFFNATTAASGYQISGTTIVKTDATYTYVIDPSGGQKFFFGNASDKTNYFRNDTTRLQSVAGNDFFVASNATTTAGLHLGTNTNNTLTLMIAFAAPTISAGFCATSPSIPNANGTVAFSINVGTSCTGATTGTLALPTATTGWVCSFYNVTAPATNVVRQTGGATNTATLTNYNNAGTPTDFTASNVIRANCMAY